MKQKILMTERDLRGQLEQIAGDLQSQVKKEQKKLGTKPTKKDKTRVEQLTMKAQQTLRQQQTVAQQKANQLRADLIQEFRSEVKAVAEPIARGQGASIVKISAQDILWFDPALDITGEVISQMRAEIK
jgi:Skp family chaperone for outer membrane proteins